VKEYFTQIYYTAEIVELQINALEKPRNFLKIQDPAGSWVLNCFLMYMIKYHSTSMLERFTPLRLSARERLRPLAHGRLIFELLGMGFILLSSISLFSF
jgi:hypothetical protein